MESSDYVAGPLTQSMDSKGVRDKLARYQKIGKELR